MKFLANSILSALAVLMLAAAPARAEYPERNITIIVPFPAGGASDMTARLVSGKLSERVKQTVVIDNRAGANGAIGSVALKQAAADGYTLLIGSIGVFAINPALFKDLRYDPQKDFDLLQRGGPHAQRAGGKSRFSCQQCPRADRSTQQKSRQGDFCILRHRLVGSSDSRAVLAEDRHNRNPRPLSRRGPAINDLIAGHANVSFQNLGAIAEQVKSGRLKALAVTSGQRVAALPDVPTMAEAGVKDLEVYSWQAAAAPKGLPAAIKAKLEAELAASAQSPDAKAKFEAVGFDVVANNGSQFVAFLAEEIARWKTVIETGKITPD